MLTTPEVDRASDVALYRTMLLIREVESGIERVHRQGRINGSFHSSLGQESAAAGVCAALGPDDIVTSNHRGHGHAIAKGVTADAVIGELYRKTHGTTGGRGASMHLHDRSVNFYGESAIVGGTLPWAAGAGWARRRLGKPGIAVAFAGDGGFANGVFSETIRTARHWSAPCLFVCENNGWAHSMSAERVFGPPGSIARQAAASGIEARYVDGRDVRDVYAVAQELVALVRTGVPAFLEVGVYRVRPHSLTDADYMYRGKRDGADWLDMHDPLALLRSRLRPVEAEAVDEEVAETVRQAIEKGEAGAVPAAETAEMFVYSTKGLHWNA
ncbi:hypothetical protein BVC93_16560 [Mycobacterium sp. MS1601]|nr:hypothetical protein BVC93_16560 [Mycobacterium sp. MS1601]